MEYRHKRTLKKERPLPHPSAFDLRGRQSVRATFKLSPTAIEALSIVAAHLGIKQKSIFDHLMEDARSLIHIAREFDRIALEDLERVQKTFVLSRNTLQSLEKTAEQFDAPRDALVELSIQRLLPIISKERQKHAVRKEILNDISRFLNQGLEMLAKFETDLGNEDPTTVQFSNAIKALAGAQEAIRDFVNKGDLIEGFDLEQLAVGTMPGDEQMDNELN